MGRGLVRIVGTFVLLASAVSTARAFACECSGVEYDPRVELESHSTVFYGEVIRVGSGCGCNEPSGYTDVPVRFEVLEGFKGVEAGDLVDVTTAPNGGSCGIGFQKGWRWLVYTSGTVNLCDPGGPVEPDDPELDILRDVPP